MFEQFPLDARIEFRIQLDRTRTSDAPSPLGSAQEHIFRKVFRQIPGNILDRHPANIHDTPAPERIKHVRNPRLRNVTVKDAMQVWKARFRILKDTNIGRRDPEFSFEIDAKRVKDQAQMRHREFFVFELFRVHSQRQEIAQLQAITLLQMLGENGMAVYDARIKGVTRGGLMQSFSSAAQAFQAIDCQTQGVVVPFRKEGMDLIAELSAAHDLALEFRLLRRAQIYSVNVFQHEMEYLKRNDAVYEAQPGTGVLCLRKQFYSNEFGLYIG